MKAKYKYRVWDIEDNKERTIHEAYTDLGEVGSVRRVQIKKNGVYEEHHFKILEVLQGGE